MQTYLGLTQRTPNGRFLYGRPQNYRLNTCLVCLRNPDNDLGSIDPLDGDSPLDVEATIPEIPEATLTPGINSNWPAPAAGGMSSPVEGGGIAVQGSGYARVNDPDPIEATQTWVWGDDTDDEEVDQDTVTEHTYEDSGAFVPNLICTDALDRANTQILDTVSVDAAAPENLVATGGTLSIGLVWDAVPGADTYNVYRSNTSGGGQTLIASGLASPTYNDTGLPAGTSRFYKVAGVNEEGIGAQSTEATAITLCAAVTSPAALGGANKIDLTWDAMTGAATYKVFRSSTTGGTFTQIAAGIVPASYSNTGLLAAATWFYKIKATNAAGDGPFSAEVTATTDP